jgi:flagellar hook-associated protein FlgK
VAPPINATAAIAVVIQRARDIARSIRQIPAQLTRLRLTDQTEQQARGENK